MHKIAILIVAMLTMGSLVVIIPNQVKAVQERNWLPLNQDIKIGGGYPTVNGYIKVNVSDVIHFYWSSGYIANGMGAMEIYFYFSVPPIDFSDGFVESYTAAASGHGYLFYYLAYSWGQASPKSEWIRSSSYDLVYVSATIFSGNNLQTVNFDVQKEIPDIYAMDNSITNLETNLNALNVSTNASLNALNATFTDALNETNNLLNATNTTINANLTKLWSSYLDNLTITNNEILSNYQYLQYTNQSFNEMWDLTNSLVNKSIDLQSQLANVNVTLLERIIILENENQQLQSKLDGLKNNTDANSSKISNNVNNTNNKLSDRIVDAKKLANNNILYAGIIVIVLCVIITVMAIIIYDGYIKKRYGKMNAAVIPTESQKDNKNET